MKNLEYIYEDDDIIVCHKPAGMATEGAGPGKMDLVSNVRNYLTRKNRQNGDRKPAYVGTVYRLDQPVEGVVVVAKNKKAASNLAQQIKNHTTDKFYYALCFGNVELKKGHVENYLIRREDSGLADIISESEKETLDNGVIIKEDCGKVRLINGEVKKAVLDYEVISGDEQKSLLNIKLLTGRFHQIRVQMSGLGYPILGDSKYGNEDSIRFSEENGIKNVCLACYKFGFKHPGTGKKVSFEITPEFIHNDK